MGFRIRGFHPLWPLFPEGSPIRRRATSRSRNPGKQASRFGLVRFRSPLLAQSRLMSSPAGTEMFHFPAYGSCGLSLFIRRCRPAKGGGLPHSETSGSKPVDGSPKLVAVFRVLHRLPMPRHPSCARIRLARKSSSLVSYMSCNSLLFPASGCQRSSRPFGANRCVVYQIPRASARGNFKKKRNPRHCCRGLRFSRSVLSVTERARTGRSSSRRPIPDSLSSYHQDLP